MEISEHLIINQGFSKVFKFIRKGDVDLDRVDCIKRIHIAHYLMWSDTHKHFTLAFKHDTPKGKAGGGYEDFIKVMIPKSIYSPLEADKLIESIT